MLWWLPAITGYLLVLLLICRAFRRAARPDPEMPLTAPGAAAQAANQSDGVPDRAA
jgi:hypothetical protein